MKRILSFALVLCLLISAVPASVVATEVEQTESVVAPAEQTMSTAAPAGQIITAGTITTEQLPIGEITIVREETSLRGQYEKHFLMSDGSYQAVVYSEPVHKLVDGVWVELDKEDLADASINSDTSTDSTQQNIIDNYVLEGSGVQNSNLNRLYIGNKSGSIARAFIQFAVMPTIPQGAAITAATMTLTIYEGTSTANNASAYMVTGGEWTSGTISWENMPAAETLLQENISHNNLTKYQFSCLSAVQHWYDGDITGQNENYGVMVRYYDETIADYNSVFSADYTVATQRPTLTIGYTPASSSIEVEKGGTKTLTVNGATGTVTWTSNNPSVATVDANGVVTGVELGTATITASIGDMEYQTFTVSVILADGVYYISNQNSGLRLETNGATEENTPVVQFSTSTDNYEQICRLWKITYLGDGYYSIRPMHKLIMGLHADGTAGSSVSIVDIGTSDTLSAVSPLNRWGISPKPGGGGYFIDHVGTSSLRLRSLEGSSSPGLGVTISSETHETAYHTWSLIEVDTPENGVVLYDLSSGAIATLPTRYVEISDTKSLWEIDLLPICFPLMNEGAEAFTWTSAGTSVTVNQNTGAVTAHFVTGQAVLITGNSDHGAVQFMVYAVIPDGNYFIKCRAYDKYLQIDNLDASNEYSTSGAIIEQWDYDGGDYQQWQITSLEGGYYSIVSVRSGLALSVPSGSTLTGDVTLDQEAYFGLDRQKWKIIQTFDGYYKIKPKSAEGLTNEMVIAVGYNETNDSNDVNIEQRYYVNDTNYKDEWQLRSLVRIGVSTDNYSGGVDRGLSSYHYANKFYEALVPVLASEPITWVHHYNRNSTHTASKNDFAANGAISNDIDFMIYIGHGHSITNCKHNPNVNHIQYSHATDGTVNANNICAEGTYSQEKKDKFCLYVDDVHFGSAASDLRWVWMYTCYFLSTNEYVTNDDLREMMTGAHIVMGYATQSYLCDPNVELFGQYLRDGMPIIEAYFQAGRNGEALCANDNHLQKVMYIPQAEHETIYSPNVHYDYDPSDVLIRTSYIKGETDIDY